MKKNKGFSLVELIVVIAIMAILAAVAIPTFSMFIRKAQEASDRAYMKEIEYAIMLAHVDELDVEMGSVIVYVDPETDKAVWIDYELLKDGVLWKEYDSKLEKTRVDNASAIIDWDYQFKALDLQENTYEWAEGNWHFEVYEEELDQSQAGGDGNVDSNTPDDNKDDVGIGDVIGDEWAGGDDDGGAVGNGNGNQSNNGNNANDNEFAGGDDDEWAAP